MTRLLGKTAVITGGGTGIGLGAAKRFIDEGAFVYLFDVARRCSTPPWRSSAIRRGPCAAR